MYTSVLLQHLARPIDITKIFRIVTTEVQKQQAGKTNPMQPWYNANLLGGEEDIVLVQSASVGRVAAAQLHSPAGGGGVHGMGAAQSCIVGGGASIPAAPAFVMPLDAGGNPDFGPMIQGSLAAWRATHPNALLANVCGREDLTDSDFAYLRGIKALGMNGCNQPTITDAAFVHLAGIHTLFMGYCDQPTITDAAFVHLAGIHTLDMSFCTQPTITLSLIHISEPTRPY